MKPQLELTNASLIFCPHIDNSEIYIWLKKVYPMVKGIVEGTCFFAGGAYVFDHEAGSNYSQYYGGKESLETSAGKIILMDQGYTINPALESLSKAYKEIMIAVILSGCGNDGAKGAKIVRENGGKVLVQSEPGAINFMDYMPQAAIDACGEVDFVGDIRGITQKLNQLLSGN
jgi:chemotaxis response regulator CheB